MDAAATRLGITQQEFIRAAIADRLDRLKRQ
jgi:hypothetical protein